MIKLKEIILQINGSNNNNQFSGEYLVAKKKKRDDKKNERVNGDWPYPTGLDKSIKAIDLNQMVAI